MNVYLDFNVIHRDNSINTSRMKSKLKDELPKFIGQVVKNG